MQGLRSEVINLQSEVAKEKRGKVRAQKRNEYMEQKVKQMETRMNENQIEFSRKLRTLQKKYGSEFDLDFLGMEEKDDGVASSVIVQYFFKRIRIYHLVE